VIINNTADPVGSYLQITLLCLPKHTFNSFPADTITTPPTYLVRHAAPAIHLGSSDLCRILPSYLPQWDSLGFGHTHLRSLRWEPGGSEWRRRGRTGGWKCYKLGTGSGRQV